MISREITITSLYPTTRFKSFQMPINNYSNTNSSQYEFQQNNLSYSLCEHISVHYRLTIECIRSKGALILINSILSYVRVILPFLSQIFFYFFVIEITHPVLFFSFLLFFSVARYNLWSLACIHWLICVLSPPLTSTEYQLGPP